MDCETLICRLDSANSIVKFWLQVRLVVDGKVYQLDPTIPFNLSYFGGSGYDQYLGSSITVNLLYVGPQTTENPSANQYNPEFYVGHVPNTHSPSAPISTDTSCHIPNTMPILKSLDVDYTVDTNPAACQTQKQNPYDHVKCG